MIYQNFLLKRRLKHALTLHPSHIDRKCAGKFSPRSHRKDPQPLVTALLAINDASAHSKCMGCEKEHHTTLFPARRLAASAQQVLEAVGEQWTPLRAAVFDALVTFSAPASAYNITRAVCAAQGRRVLANSIYRILDLFIAHNVAMRVESENGYIVNAHPEHHHDCIFLVCNRCGKIQHVDDDEAVEHIRVAAQTARFIVERPMIELRGYCESCNEHHLSA